MYHYKPHLKNSARELRKNMTDAEIKLRNRIKGKQIADLQFYRQKPLGKYIVDFYCHAKGLVIEIDGGQHYEIRGIKKDKERDEYLEDVLGLKVFRFNNLEVLKNIEGVAGKILEAVS